MYERNTLLPKEICPAIHPMQKNYIQESSCKTQNKAATVNILVS